jgi:hypothetical protein
MKLLFQVEDQVHTFEVTEAINEQDLSVLQQSLFRFFESAPSYTILNLSQAKIAVAHADFERALSEISTFATGHGLNFMIARTADEAFQSKQTVMEMALHKQVEILQGKLELREKMRTEAEFLVSENLKLKSAMDEQIQRLKELQRTDSPLNPLLEKLWSEK